MSFGKRLRTVFARMGGVYVKLGQFLSIRYDLLSPTTCEELSRLLDDVEAEPFDTVRRTVEAELRAPLESSFAFFAHEPIAAASIAQVYRAVAHDGEVLAVKVRRSSVASSMSADLGTLRALARLAARVDVTHGGLLVQLADEFSEFTLRELDFVLEAGTAERIAAESPPYVRVPRIRWPLTTTGVLTMEFIEGTSLLEICRRAEAGDLSPFPNLPPGKDAQGLLADLTNACLHQAYVTGRFHGDPHPANLMVDMAGRITFLDFGIFGELSNEQLKDTNLYLLNLTEGRFSAAFRHFESSLIYSPHTAVADFRQELVAVLRRWYAVSSDQALGISEKIAARFQDAIMEVMRKHGVRMKPNYILFWRAQAMLDATAQRLPLKFELLQTVAQFLRKHGRSGVEPELDAACLTRISRDLAFALAGLGRQLIDANCESTEVRCIGAEQASNRLLTRGRLGQIVLSVWVLGFTIVLIAFASAPS